MKRKKNRESDSFSISFLDVASCGFGAMIILLLIANPGIRSELLGVEVPERLTVPELQEQLFTIRGETTLLSRELNAKQEQLSSVKDRVARLRRDLEDLRQQHDASSETTKELSEELGYLDTARQTLSAEMQRLLAQTTVDANNVVGGVPVDSEYIIFVIDTSGSMQSYSWNKMLQVIENTLAVYPEVKGIQVMNDQGTYMFPSFARQWIPDTPSRL